MAEILEDLSHDSVNRFLLRERYTPKDLFDEVKPHLNLTGGTLSTDDTIADKPYSDPAKEDESRLGLHTLGGWTITGFGVKPVGPWQWKFEAFWLYGAVDPWSGEHFILEFSHADTACFQRFLEELSARYPDEFHIIHLDRGRSHTAKKLEIPENILLLFQPPYSPELNPIERLWRHLKRDLRWQVFSTLEQLRDRVKSLLKQLPNEVVLSLTGWDYIRHVLSVAQIN